MNRNEQSLVYHWFNHRVLLYRHNSHKEYDLRLIICVLNYSLTGGFMDPDPTPLPRWRNTFFR
ncbi:mgtA regulatory leader peptide MgtL [Citrobacter sedlakii]|uniref:mgtA leader peptide n=1 Tax=Citrobacter sedlakii TaxID=67826 RepID=A0ABS0ZW33_9ENTR|nr:mgtA regulatory leader peptide MgtL [Citrobacter sedlakii]QMK47658.1 mgtA regulatory leader peptide MgtL [Citrobacter sp. RHB21-C05]QMK66102.1 mgtA regulatory leader peptide MgtL [Citrobacter sp. RHB21-C01]EHG7610756.1 mgtA regulatory leader peptide MgtL [Citrobacter sedlakii]EIQ7158191.1 mgtA regulatory leader peptide MgtL [Citrobacter sedlakii]